MKASLDPSSSPASVGGVAIGGFVAVAVAADGTQLPAARLTRLVTQEARALDSRALIQREAGAVVALVALSQPLGRLDCLNLAEALRRRVAATAEVSVSAGVGVVGKIGDTRQLGRACWLACAALTAGRRVLGPGRTADLRGLGAQGVMALLAETTDLELFSQDLLEPLVEYDTRRRGRLLPTLEAYFASRQQLAGTAERLAEHRNTVLYRLALIERLTNRSLRDPDDVLCFMLSLKTRLLQGSPAAEGAKTGAPGRGRAGRALPASTSA